MLKPSPAVVHYILTHFQWFWDFVNNCFLQGTFMRLVLTGRCSETTLKSQYHGRILPLHALVLHHMCIYIRHDHIYKLKINCECI